jgi:hypothetical protein
MFCVIRPLKPAKKRLVFAWGGRPRLLIPAMRTLKPAREQQIGADGSATSSIQSNQIIFFLGGMVPVGAR